MEQLPNKEINIFGQTNFRNQQTRFGIKTDDRRRHMYVIGKTGSGKSNLLETMAINDIRAGHGLAVIDPHGEFAERMLDFVPEERIDDVIYFAPFDFDHPIAFNPLEQIGTEFRHLVASGMMGVFKKIWPDVWSARMEYILNNTILALLEYPDSTLLGIMRMFAEPAYRARIVENLTDPVVKAFWTNEFARYTQRLETEAVAAIQNKVGQFVSNPLIRNILGQPRSAINMRKIMDERKILIVNLSKGKIGEDNARLLGAMIIARLQLAAMSRVDVPESERKDFFAYVDEFQNFATDSFANILSEARKYHLCLILANQYIRQLIDGDNTRVRDAVFGNVGTMAAFRVGAEDAEFLEKEFEPEFMLNDLVNLPKYNIYIKLMIDGVASHPFSAQTLSPLPTPEATHREVLIENTRTRYGTPRRTVEERIAKEWMEESPSLQRIVHRGEQSLSHALRAPGVVKDVRGGFPARPAGPAAGGAGGPGLDSSRRGGPPPRGEPRPLGGPASSSSQGGFSRPGQDRPRFSGDRSLRREGAAGDLRKAIGNILQKQQTEQEKKPPQGGEPRQSGGPPASASDKE